MSTTTIEPGLQRQAPALGGFNLTLLGLELRRLLRNRRTVIMTAILPGVMFLVFGVGQSYADDRVGHGNGSAFVMISLAAYGAVLAATSGGAMVSVERATGWSRQLRLTPLTSPAYVAVKLTCAMVLGLGSLLVVFLMGAFSGAEMPLRLWLVTGLIAWLGSSVFAAFGLFMGYLLPTENVMQILGPGLAVLAFASGLFVPLDQMGTTFEWVARFTPLYGLNQLVHAPLTGAAVQLGWLVNVAAWLAVFAGGAVWRFRRDTARV